MRVLLASVLTVMGLTRNSLRRADSVFPMILVVALIGVVALTMGGCRSGSGTAAPTTGRPTGGAKGASSAASRAGDPSVSTTAARKPESPPDPGPMIEIEQDSITLKWIDNGKVRMSATAREGKVDERTKTSVLSGFVAELYEDGKLTSTLAAPKVVADAASRVLTATGGVTVKSVERKTVIKADWIKWYARHQKIIGNGGVTIKSDTWDLRSAAFVADTGLKALTLKNSAKGLLPE